jgi:hypothetical protein
VTEHDAIRGIGYLCAATTGWNDDAVDVYVQQCRRFQDAGAFQRAMYALARHWPHGRRPLMSDITIAYSTELRNREMERQLVADTGVIPTLDEGVAAARTGYLAECRLQQRQPSSDVFDHWAAVLTTRRAQRLARSSEPDGQSVAHDGV